MKALIVRLCSDRSLISPRTLVLGSVEVRGSKTETETERAAVEESCRAFQEESDVEFCPRLATVTEGPSLGECEQYASVAFEEALDLLDQELFGMGRLSLRGAGYSREIPAGRLVPRQPGRTGPFGPTTSFTVLDEDFPLRGMPEHLSQISGSELLERYRRAAHWLRRARWEPSRQVRTLHRWFAIEAACKVHKDFSVVPIVCTALGFPKGQHGRFLTPKMSGQLERDAQLDAQSRYSFWSRKVLEHLEELQRWRNDSVHSGFRPWDIQGEKLRLFDKLALLGSARVMALLRDAIVRQICTAETFNDYLALLIEERWESYVDDVHGTVMWSLDHSHEPGE